MDFFDLGSESRIVTFRHTIVMQSSLTVRTLVLHWHTHLFVYFIIFIFSEIKMQVRVQILWISFVGVSAFMMKITTIIVKSVGKVALFTSSFPSSPHPWPNVDQNVNVCAGNCSVISQH